MRTDMQARSAMGTCHGCWALINTLAKCTFACGTHPHPHPPPNTHAPTHHEVLELGNELGVIGGRQGAAIHAQHDVLQRHAYCGLPCHACTQQDCAGGMSSGTQSLQITCVRSSFHPGSAQREPHTLQCGVQLGTAELVRLAERSYAHAGGGRAQALSWELVRRAAHIHARLGGAHRH